jgi:hypothetical protein
VVFLVLSGIGIANSSQWSVSWTAGMLITLGLGPILLIQLVIFCIAPMELAHWLLNKFAALGMIYCNKDRKRPEGIMLAEVFAAVPLYNMFQKVGEFVQTQFFEDRVKQLRLGFFAVSWVSLLISGLLFFTNLFMILKHSQIPLGLRGFGMMFFESITALSGIVTGEFPSGIAGRAVLALLVLFQIFCLVLLVLIHSLGTASDLRKLQVAVLKNAESMSECIVETIHFLLIKVPTASEVAEMTVTKDLLEVFLPKRKTWQSLRDVKKEELDEETRHNVEVRFLMPIDAKRIISRVWIHFYLRVNGNPSIGADSMRWKGIGEYEGGTKERGFTYVSFHTDLLTSMENEVAILKIEYDQLCLTDGDPQLMIGEKTFSSLRY